VIVTLAPSVDTLTVPVTSVSSDGSVVSDELDGEDVVVVLLCVDGELELLLDDFVTALDSGITRPWAVAAMAPRAATATMSRTKRFMTLLSGFQTAVVSG
jgi:hypothetical protein